MFTINHENFGLTIASWIALFIILTIGLAFCYSLSLEITKWRARRKHIRENEKFFQNIEEFYNDIG